MDSTTESIIKEARKQAKISKQNFSKLTTELNINNDALNDYVESRVKYSFIDGALYTKKKQHGN